MKYIVLATKNKGKIKEIYEILKEYKDYLKTLDNFIKVSLPEEIGKTYEENALLKAKFVSEKLNLPAIGEDSGLEIDMLKHILGIYSSRFEEGLSYKERMNIILEKMKDIPWEKRTARFVCKVVYYDHKEDIKIVTGGVVEGYIAYEIRGDFGFGYDPIFYYPPLGKTFGELKEQEKNEISHRSVAFRKLKDFFPILIKGG
jgi:XTP/dITP diphosphohydrolase